jgi:hypothetical protein
MRVLRSMVKPLCFYYGKTGPAALARWARAYQ